MSFLIDDILKGETYNSCKKEEQSSIKGTPNSQNNISILECSLRNRIYYQSFFSQNEFVNYNSLSSPSFKHYMDHINDSKYQCNENYYSRYNYAPYPSMYFNNQISNKTRKGGQIRFTSSQTEELEKHFNSHKYLSPEDRKQLATLLCLSDRQVKTWFQNRRAKWRKYNVTEGTKKEEYSNFNNNKDYLYLRG